MSNQLIDTTARLQDFEALCQQRGLPLTVQRRVIYEALLQRADHPTADAIYQQVQDRIPGVSRTTVYRVLDTLVELGVIQRIQHEGSSVRFDPVLERHHHLVCRHCEAVLDLEEPRLNRVKLPDTGSSGFEIQDYSVYFSGSCARCRKEEPK